MTNRMKVKLDTSGRIVVPKLLRDRFGLKPDMVLEVEEHADGVFLRVPTPHPTMVQVDGLWAPACLRSRCRSKAMRSGWYMRSS